MFSPPTLRFDPQGLSRIVGGRLVNDLRPVLGREVAGIGSSGRLKVAARGGASGEGERTRIGERENGFPLLETLKP